MQLELKLESAPAELERVHLVEAAVTQADARPQCEKRARAQGIYGEDDGHYQPDTEHDPVDIINDLESYQRWCGRGYNINK